MRVGDEEVVFKLPETMKHPQEFNDALFSLEDTNEVISSYVQEYLEID